MTRNITTTTTRTAHGVFSGDRIHWVGDGFRVMNLFPSGNDLYAKVSPWLLMDYAEPHVFAPTDRPGGVGVHPHRGFETVTIAIEGSVAHHDSTGAGGVIHPGDVQWMTAASGILHKEYHEAEWAKKGGSLSMVQLWVNLPAAHKMDAPGYQTITDAEMPRVPLYEAGGDGGVVVGSAKLVTGSLGATAGPARTFTPMALWDAALTGQAATTLALPSAWNASLFVIDGELSSGGATARPGELLVLEHDGELIGVSSPGPARFLVLAGEPLNEPVAYYGPFVMNSRAELVQAVEDFNSGRFGQLAD